MHRPRRGGWCARLVSEPRRNDPRSLRDGKTIDCYPVLRCYTLIDFVGLL
jgi:hypothetical protein